MKNETLKCNFKNDEENKHAHKILQWISQLPLMISAKVL